MTASSESAPAACHLCGASELEVSTAYPAFHRVTSDCKPWVPGGALARCRRCGLVQTVVSPAWQEECTRIYQTYTIYHQSGGSEQRVFDGRGGAGRPRSEQIIESLRRSESLPARGRLLDVGCGNGGFLSAWSRLVPGWSLAGTEFDAKYRREVESIPGVEKLYLGDLNDIPGTFDVITLIHVLEHIPSPLGLLRQLRGKLNPAGLLMVEVPDCGQNVFMLLVADHCSHFSPPLLAGVVSAAGFEVAQATNQWVTKEVTVVARRPVDAGASAESASAPRSVALPPPESDRVFAGGAELARILDRVTPLLDRPQFGLFGTAIAATWLDAQTGNRARFFVDEDPNRTGKTHFGRPILAPKDLPRGATVFVALPEVLSGPISQRLRNLGLDLEVVVP